ncbi:MAG TPA: shikimate dehydrogenase [Candidatus Hydrogenedentes bacterium]|nr:shikimate dehydrogenase [Candidatus Hydrogenedentota bacterium]
MRSIDTATRLCAVIGNPVEHSLSPRIHNAAFEAAGLNYVYVAFRVEDIAGCLAGMRALPSFRGLSVTIPHKMRVMAHLDAIDAIARHVGSVNTVTNDNGTLIGSTTDGPGALRAFADAGVSLDGKRVLFVGSGGAVRAVAFAVAELTRAEQICILGRTPERVAAIVDDLRAKTAVAVASGHLSNALTEAMATHDVVIHGTPIGMYPNADQTGVPAALFRQGQVILDMVYRPYRTRLLREAEDAGCTTIAGVEMLVNQAVLQFETWTGVAAPAAVMRNAVVGELAKEQQDANRRGQRKLGGKESA